MKKIFVIASGILLFSCSKKESEFSQTKSDSAKIIESINVARTKINDSIRLKNDKNIYADLSGTHSLKFTSEGVSMSSGKVIFKKRKRIQPDKI